MGSKDLFEKVFDAKNSEGVPIVEEKDRELAFFIYEAALEEFRAKQGSYEDDCADAFSEISFENKVEATRANFERIVELFKQSTKARYAFLRNFQKWGPTCKKHVKLLREIAEEIHDDKFNSDIAKLVGGVVGAVGGVALAISIFTPLGPIAAPLYVGGGAACGLGGGLTVGAASAEIALLKIKLEEAKRILKEQQENFALMAHWFCIPEELKKNIDALVSYEVLKKIKEDIAEFFSEIKRHTNLTIGDFKIQFKELLQDCMRQMNESGKITLTFGLVFTPIVMTFIFFVALFKGNNRIVLDCILLSQRLAFGLMNVLDLGVQAGQLLRGMLKGAADCGDEFFKLAFTKFIVCLGVVIDLVNVVLCSIDIHKRAEPELTKKLKEAAEQLENVLSVIEDVYNETRKLENSEKNRISVIVEDVPDEATPKDIKEVVKLHLPDEAWGAIKLQRLPTEGKHWLVELPIRHYEQLLRQSPLIIKEKPCVLKR